MLFPTVYHSFYKKLFSQVLNSFVFGFHKNFFHEAIGKIREGGYKKTIIVGGPHPTTSYNEVLKDENIDICAIGEGEQILADVVDKLMKNNKDKLNKKQLELIDGIAFIDKKDKEQTIDHNNNFSLSKEKNISLSK